MTNFTSLIDSLNQFLALSGFAHITLAHLVMIAIGLVIIYLAIAKQFVPMLLVPIGFGILVGNIPYPEGLHLGLSEQGSVFNYLSLGLMNGVYPSLIFLGIGAMTDFSSLISNPKLILISFAVQIGIFGAYFLATTLGFNPFEASSISLIGCASAPTAIFLGAKLAPQLVGIIGVTAYLYLALAPAIQPFFLKLVTTSSERVIKMKSPRAVSKTEKMVFPIVGFLIVCFFVPASIPLLGMLFLGNILKESTVTSRLSDTAKGPILDVVTVLIGLSIGVSLYAPVVLNLVSLKIVVIGLVSFSFATIVGVLIIKVLNIFLKEGSKINPLLGSAGLSSFPDSARVSQTVGQEFDSSNHLLMHAMGPNIAAVIGSAIAAGIILGFLL